MAQKQINIDPSETGIFNVLLLLGVLRVNNSVFNSSTTPLQGPPPAPPSAARSKALSRAVFARSTPWPLSSERAKRAFRTLPASHRWAQAPHTERDGFPFDSQSEKAQKVTIHIFKTSTHCFWGRKRPRAPCSRSTEAPSAAVAS